MLLAECTVWADLLEPDTWHQTRHHVTAAAAAVLCMDDALSLIVYMQWFTHLTEYHDLVCRYCCNPLYIYIF